MKHLIIIVAILVALYINLYRSSAPSIANLTDEWINAVTVQHSPTTIANMFCPDGNLVGTVSQIKRTGIDIKRYFNYFSKLPGIQVVDRQYNISKVTKDVYLNTAFITWMWDDLEEPITARMTFLYRGSCIFQLHSSALPDINESLLDISENA